MAVTHPTAVRDGICNFVVDQIDEGTPPGTLVFQTTVSTLAGASLSASVGTGSLLAQFATSSAIGLTASAGVGVLLAAVAFMFGSGSGGAADEYGSYRNRLRKLTCLIAMRSRRRK